ncbi:kinase-like protein [Aspergillus brunneoviolaceus CBS 621.78]|uniref:Kinase-like protein n=1 Tax=Aspergillus brunneoviolaceus CBS 621.78 TaxID=1450534 RepID=A0ACD1GFB0_9EURO|nr:kinase-like protein [Aspergillus brunneoviolaceus CBS 621.78]RAH47809.1 kinase-like protein [Aspergillus brunneoviolaceus CBS 621.78]
MLTPRSTVPCSACNFSPERQRCCDYESDVKIFYEASDRGVWALGSDLILKDRGPMLPTDESANLCFVKENTTIPVPTVITHRAGNNGHALTIITRIPGEPLNEAWPKLTDDEKENIAKQTAEYLLQLRALQSDRIEGLDGRPIYSDYLYTEDGRQYAPCPPLKSDDNVWNGMAARLNPDLPEAVRRRLRRYMPPTKPFTFTHNDLTHVNIMVQNGELAGIIDWERAGYFPVWWEYIGTILTGEGQDDLDWKSLLAQYMPDMEDAFEWFLDYHNLCKPDLDTRRSKAFIQASEEEESKKNESGVDEPEVDES